MKYTTLQFTKNNTEIQIPPYIILEYMSLSQILLLVYYTHHGTHNHTYEAQNLITSNVQNNKKN